MKHKMLISAQLRDILQNPAKAKRLREMIANREYELQHDGLRNVMVVKWPKENDEEE